MMIYTKEDFPEELKTDKLFTVNKKFKKGKPTCSSIHCLEHRFVWFQEYGWLPSTDSGYSIDHINRDPHDNRIENLRLADKYQQQLNKAQRKDNTTGFIGIWCQNKDSGCYRARISLRSEGSQKTKSLGYYSSNKSAAIARDVGLCWYLEESDLDFVVWNFPDRVDSYCKFCETTPEFKDKISVMQYLSEFPF